MVRYVALLRGINVGGKSTVPMGDLRTLFTALGFLNVTTYINSGNVLFESTEGDRVALRGNIETALKKKFGFAVGVVVRTHREIAKLAATIPAEWTNDTAQKTDILFLWDEYDNKKTIALISTHPDVDRLRYLSGAIVWNIARAQYGKSGMKKFIGTEVYKNMTARNVNTVRKLALLLDQ